MKASGENVDTSSKVLFAAGVLDFCLDRFSLLFTSQTLPSICNISIFTVTFDYFFVVFSTLIYISSNVINVIIYNLN